MARDLLRRSRVFHYISRFAIIFADASHCSFAPDASQRCTLRGFFLISPLPRYWTGESPIGRGSNPSKRYEVAPPLRTIRRETVKNPSFVAGSDFCVVLCRKSHRPSYRIFCFQRSLIVRGN